MAGLSQHKTPGDLQMLEQAFHFLPREICTTSLQSKAKKGGRKPMLPWWPGFDKQELKNQYQGKTK